MPDRVKPSFAIFDIRALYERQSARVSKITNDGLTHITCLNPVWKRLLLVIWVKPLFVIFDIRAL